MSTRDDRLDAAIDDVARAMTEGAPHPAFAARVLARVDTKTAPMLPLAWRTTFACAAAAIVIAIGVWRPWNTKMPAPATHEAAVVRPTPPEESPGGTRGKAPADREGVDARPKSGRALIADVTPDRRRAIAVTGARVDGAAPISIGVTPVSVDPLAVAAIGRPDSIQPNALEPVTPIAVTPLPGDDPERRFR